VSLFPGYGEQGCSDRGSADVSHMLISLPPLRSSSGIVESYGSSIHCLFVFACYASDYH
jgi:hypothetical protein